MLLQTRILPLYHFVGVVAEGSVEKANYPYHNYYYFVFSAHVRQWKKILISSLLSLLGIASLQIYPKQVHVINTVHFQSLFLQNFIYPWIALPWIIDSMFNLFWTASELENWPTSKIVCSKGKTNVIIKNCCFVITFWNQSSFVFHNML